MTKPLKTVDKILDEIYLLQPRAIVRPSKKVKQAKADLYQLMLSLKPDNEFEETQWEIGYNQAITDWEAKLSEHFNGEELAKELQASTKGGER